MKFDIVVLSELQRRKNNGWEFNILDYACFDVWLDVLHGLMFFMQRSQKKQAEKRMESLNKLQKGYEVITIGGLYGTVDEVDTENKTIVLDVDGVYLTFELGAIRTVLPVKEAVTPEGAVIEEGSAIEE